MVSGWLGLSIYVLIVSVAAHGSPGDTCPRHRGLPKGVPRGENSFKERALYRLDLRHALKGYTPNEVYTFRVHTTVRKVRFNDASIAIEALDPECGTGELLANDPGLYSPRGCPDVVTTQQKEPMGRAHFRWRAPSCGCVYIRARVHANSVYYLEDEQVHNGALAKTVCSKDVMAKLEEESRRRNEAKKNPEALRLAQFEKLCDVSQHHKMEHVLKSDAFISRRHVRIADEFELDRLNIALEQRKASTLHCCNLGGNQMLECFGDVRRRRIDSFCGTGEPEVPFSKSRYGWIKQRESECCWQIGEARYTCFNYTLYRQAMPQDDSTKSLKTPETDLDDFDPANDVDDFNTDILEDNNEIKKKTTHKEPRKEEKVSSALTAETDENVEPNVRKTGGRRQKHVEDDCADEDQNSGGSDRAEAEVTDESGDRGNVQSDRKYADADSSETDEAQGAISADKDQSSTSRQKVESEEELHEESKDEEDDINDDDDDDDDTNIDTDRTFTDDECCFNGIDAGARVVSQGWDGCFAEADKFNNVFSNWNRRCDRRFVMCCMRVIDGTTKLVKRKCKLRNPYASRSFQSRVVVKTILSMICDDFSAQVYQLYCKSKLIRFFHSGETPALEKTSYDNKYSKRKQARKVTWLPLRLRHTLAGNKRHATWPPAAKHNSRLKTRMSNEIEVSNGFSRRQMQTYDRDESRYKLLETNMVDT